MSVESIAGLDEQMQRAIAEVQDLIRARYPGAAFSLAYGDDPEGMHLRVTIDIDDVEEVVDTFGERLLKLQVDEGLPLYVIPLEPEERVLQTLRDRLG